MPVASELGPSGDFRSKVGRPSDLRAFPGAGVGVGLGAVGKTNRRH